MLEKDFGVPHFDFILTRSTKVKMSAVQRQFSQVQHFSLRTEAPILATGFSSVKSLLKVEAELKRRP